jgi:D-alanyl-D-alanine carboxypeptidase/D-alanyl-D-alanine-endopeptidase (penicillin-binding protein 4)
MATARAGADKGALSRKWCIAQSSGNAGQACGIAQADLGATNGAMNLLHPILAASLLIAPPALANPQQLEQRATEALAAAPAGTRFGVLVTDADGREVLAINADQRFIPASNTKLFTTAAAYALLGPMDAPDVGGGTQVLLLPGKHKAAPDIMLYGRGDAGMSSAPDCKLDCLATLADAVATKARKVGDVVGDDSLFPDQRWSPGMSWNNIGSNDATATSALSLDSNEMIVSVLPGPAGKPPLISAMPYVTIRNEAVTVADGKTSLALEHGINSREFRLYGAIPVDGGEWHDRIGVDDAADYTAWTFARMLTARGVRVTGKVRVVHRKVDHTDGVAGMAIARLAVGEPLASLTPSPLAEDVTIINKLSQNLHSELLLRRIGSRQGHGSLADGLAAERALFDRAGIPRAGYDFSDGSGMSTYNRISPRAAVALLRWAQTQDWGRVWRASLPVGGTDGTLRRRFAGTALEGRLEAKTGTLNATNTLSGYLKAASGQELTFSILANDVPDGADAVPAMDAALLLIAGAN